MIHMLDFPYVLLVLIPKIELSIETLITH